MTVRKEDVNKLGIGYRVLAGFIFFCSLIALAGVVYAAVAEPFDWAIVYGSALVGVGLHVSGSVLFTGYAPFYLLSAHGSKHGL
jgi:hypothetical protein